MARQYTKKDTGYWNRHAAPSQPPVVIHTAAAAPVPPPQKFTPFPDINYGSTNVATAGVNGGDQTLFRGQQLNSSLSDPGAFQNIDALPSFYGGFNGTRDAGYIGAGNAIGLCVKAYGGVPVVRNAIEVAVEFSAQKLIFKSDNATVQEFFDEWPKIAQLSKLTEQFFRGYYREGAAYVIPFYGMFGPSYYRNFQKSFGAKQNRIPIRYEMLNPATIGASNSLAFPYTYVRLLSTFECERLRNPLTPQDRQVYNDLPDEAKLQINSGGSSPMGIYIPLDPKRLRFAFYKKQDYEPFAIPFVWPILPSIEWKLTLTKMDKALARTIEHAILLMTVGEPGSQFNGGNGVNQNNIARLQNIMGNPALGRVLVTDYTVKANWLIPDLKEILGPEKYQVVNEDIKEGLQSILTGDDKFANAQIKAKIFIQRLEGGQNCFLQDFLMPEIISICKAMGFRTVPSVKFAPIDLQDEAIMSRLYTQLAQIGVLTAEQAVKAIETQMLPDADEMKIGQEQYKKDRKAGLYEPLIGGQKDDAAGPNGRPGGSGGGKQAGTRKSSPIGTSRGHEAFSLKTYRDCIIEAQNAEASVVAALRKRFKVKGEFSEAQNRVAHSAVKAIVSTQPRGRWVASVASTLDNPPAISTAIAADMDQILETYNAMGDNQIDDFDAAILRHCRIEPLVEIAA